MKDDPLWYKDAIIYELHVKAFRDSNGDGYGDFAGLVEKLDYIQALGVNTLWLLPFYPSPMRDDGYDVADYLSIAPEYGTLNDFKNFVKEAHARDLRVIIELVVNHTSDQHPWFQAARRAAPGSPEREFYVWSDNDKKYSETRIIFCDTETSNWTWDPVANAYYWHRFFSHQPDLNYDNPQVRRAVMDAMKFWLDMGVDGLRLDAIPYLVERDGTNNENLPETHAVLKELRAELDKHYRGKMFLAEANQWPDDVRAYFGDGDECHVAFHFPVMPRIFMALRREDSEPIIDILRRTPAIPDSCQWAIFLRNHDELTLEMVTDEERAYMYQEYAQDPRMRINVGIRRRLAPLVDNSRRRLQVLNSLLLSLPGCPVLYYGDEIGMGDNIYLGDRNGVRTPMQWSIDRNAGFSLADPGRLYQPVIMDSVYGYMSVNVEAEERDRSSLLQFMRRIINLRRQYKAFGRGSIEFITPRNRKVFAYIRKYNDEVILCVVNLSRFVQPVELDLSAYAGMTPMEMIGKTEFPRIGKEPYFLSISQHSFFWFKLEAESRPILSSPPTQQQRADIPTIMVDGEWESLFSLPLLQSFEADVIPQFLMQRRWFKRTSYKVITAKITDWIKIGAGCYWLLIEARYEDGGQEQYSFPVKIAMGVAAERIVRDFARDIVAWLKTPEEQGVLFDALVDQSTCKTLLLSISDGRKYTSARQGELRGLVAPGDFPWSAEVQGIRAPEREQTNTSVAFGESLILKVYRQMQPGANPEVEMCSQLSSRSEFQYVPRVLGYLEYLPREGEKVSLAMLQQFLPNARDMWSLGLESVRNWLSKNDSKAKADAKKPEKPGKLAYSLTGQVSAENTAYNNSILGDFAQVLAAMGRETLELHTALSTEQRDVAFTPEPVGVEFIRARLQESTERARSVFELLMQELPKFDADTRMVADRVLALGPRALDLFSALSRDERWNEAKGHFSIIRVHGDFHLGQVLSSPQGLYIVDFEGEPLVSIAERRRKKCALVDVAGMLRSLSYAAVVGASPSGALPQPLSKELGVNVKTWEVAAATQFLAAYAEGITGKTFLPADPDLASQLMRAFALDKAFYEVKYELAFRPAWVVVPLQGIVALLEGCSS